MQAEYIVNFLNFVSKYQYPSRESVLKKSISKLVAPSLEKYLPASSLA